MENKRKEYQKRYREENRQKIREYSREYSRQYRKKNPDRVKSYSDKWFKNNVPKVRAYQRAADLRRHFGLSVDDYNALLTKQNGNCAICGVNHLNLSKNLAVDHSHSTGKVRELLCDHCNLLVGHCLEDGDILLKAVSYLEKHGLYTRRDN